MRHFRPLWLSSDTTCGFNGVSTALSWASEFDALPYRGRHIQETGTGITENEKGFVGFGLFCLLSLPRLRPPDLGARPYTKAPVAVASVYNWTGFYLGVVGGGAWEDANSPRMQGGFVGGTAGYRGQTGNVVFGVEADGAWADVSAAATRRRPRSRASVGFPGLGDLEDRCDGHCARPHRLRRQSDPVLRHRRLRLDRKDQCNFALVSVSDSKFHSGWTVGAGVEAFFAPQWSVKGEYLYRSLGGETYFSGTVPTGTLNLHTVAGLGVNYHFSGPVVAKY